MRKNHLIRCALAVSILAVAALVLYACWPVWTPDRIDRSKEIGNSILDAIERFRSDHGQYPASLAELVPDYIDEIEMPVAGSKRWDYGRYKDGCVLQFGQGRDFYPGYFIERPIMDEWQLDD